MKFLSKNAESAILEQGLVYNKNASNNKKLCEKLIKEQHHFCAYTEQYIQATDSPEVDHFDSSLKYNDDYYNYYAVIRWANAKKQDELYKSAVFFKTRFYQDREALARRISFVENEFEETSPDDVEARDFIAFLGLNHPDLYSRRLKHVSRLKEIFSLGEFDDKAMYLYFNQHPEELSFPTAIEKAFGLDLEGLIGDL